MSASTPSLVLFDLDGVLVDYDRGARVAHLAGATGTSGARVWQALFESGLEGRFDAGSIDTAAYLKALGDALDAAVDVALWTAARRAAMRLAPDTVDLVRAASARCDVAILTNNGRLLIEQLPHLLPPLADLFADRALCTAALGRTKPDPDAFALAAARLGHAPEATLFVDDSPANVDGARAAGLRAEHVASPRHLRGTLARHLGLG